MIASPQMKKYFEEIEKRVNKAYVIANKARAKGFDPEDKVTVPLAKNMAERVEGLISTVAPEILGKGVVERLGELEAEFGTQDWRVALKIAEEVASEKFCKFETKKKALETGIRLGFSYITVGVVSSPLEGFANLELKKRTDNGKEYFSLYYSGPIRSAGGTGAAISVLIADYVRRKMGYATYDPSDKEIKRACTELEDYNDRVTNLQYFPSKEETAFLTKNLPVQINGDGTSDFEVSNYKDLSRIESNRIRGGFCLVMAECIALKAKKLWKQLAKWGKGFDMEQWDFLKDFLELQDKMKSKGSKKGDALISPDYTYIKDIVAGRPVLSYPLRNGGFRLRYGRSRISGFSSDALNPATMGVLRDYIAIGTQFKSERPGKSTILSVCDCLEGPIVKMKNGNVLRVETLEEARKILKDVEEVIYLGDILINYGDFLDRNHKLIPCGFNEEWWSLCLERFKKEKKFDDKKLAENLDLSESRIKELLGKAMWVKVPFEEALKISKKTSIPLHPRWIYFWNTITPEQFFVLFDCLKRSAVEKTKIIIPRIKDNEKRALELIGIPHKVVSDEYIVIEGDDAKAFLANLGKVMKRPEQKEAVLEMVNSVSDAKIKDRCGTFIGARMGRPEKAKMRQLRGNPHTLFPIGEEGGRLRSFQSAIEKGYVNAQFPIYHCEKCGKDAIFKVCENCGERTKKLYYCRKCGKTVDKPECKVQGKVGDEIKEHGKCMPYKDTRIKINHYYDLAMKKSGAKDIDLVKGIRGTSNDEHIPEHLMKGILRAKNNLHVNKDGTVRYDMTEMACTHFKPKEAHVSVEKLRQMGYTHDCFGNELKDDNQILELKAQDIILPACDEALDEGADSILFRVAKFIDDLLIRMYGLDKYYNLKKKEELIGHLCVAMSPHTAAGIISRIVGFSRTQGFLAHPLLHSIMRRDCDGDEATVMLLMDHLLNFSKKFLPSRRGSTQDAPLVLTCQLIPKEVDDMVFNMDVAWKYPIGLYEAAEQYKYAYDVDVEIFNSRLDTEGQYEGLGFTHDTSNFNDGVRCSAYKSLPSMREKVLGQMDISKKVRASDADDVARLVIERHFIRDIKGNLRKFSMQRFRCVACNEKFRRPPLKGRCTKCDGKILFTISEGSIVKYLEPAENLIENYTLSPYLQQSIELVRLRVESVFGKDPEKQEALDKWF